MQSHWPFSLLSYTGFAHLIFWGFLFPAFQKMVMKTGTRMIHVNTKGQEQSGYRTLLWVSVPYFSPAHARIALSKQFYSIMIKRRYQVPDTTLKNCLSVISYMIQIESFTSFRISLVFSSRYSRCWHLTNHYEIQIQ